AGLVRDVDTHCCYRPCSIGVGDTAACGLRRGSPATGIGPMGTVRLPSHSTVALLATLCSFVPTIGVHDLADELVSDDVVAGQTAEADVLDAVEDGLHRPQPALLALRKVHLGDVTGNH